jgi:hypothetical protein
MSLFLNLSIVVAFISAISAVLTGLRIVIQRFFDIFIEKKLLYIYFLFYMIFFVIIFALIFFDFFGEGWIFIFVIGLIISTIIMVEYVLIYKKYFDFEPGTNYLLCMFFSYFSNFMLLIMLSNLLYIVFLLLFK